MATQNSARDDGVGVIVMDNPPVNSLSAAHQAAISKSFAEVREVVVAVLQLIAERMPLTGTEAGQRIRRF